MADSGQPQFKQTGRRIEIHTALDGVEADPDIDPLLLVYIKGSEEVATLLRLTGANRGLLDFETERVGRDVRNRLNRLMNAEAANVARTVRAADRQLRAIAELESTGELRELGRGLQEAAAQRRLHPEADLDDLARALGVSRSAVNHRLRRIVEIAAPPPPSAVPTARR
jgi:DNA-binding protein WhiA